MRGPPLVERRGEGLAGRNRKADVTQRAFGELTLEHAREERWAAEEERGAELACAGRDEVRARRRRFENGRRADRHRKEDRVPEAVREERLRSGDAPVVAPDAK